MTTSGLFKPEQEPDRIAVKKILLVGAGALTIFALGVAAAGLLERKVAGGRAIPELAKPMPADLGSDKHGMVNQWLFEGDGRYRSPLEAQRHRLESYGFVDRQKGVVHIPIDEAMRRVAGERR